jgi:predicted transcriptional regulator
MKQAVKTQLKILNIIRDFKVEVQSIQISEKAGMSRTAINMYCKHLVKIGALFVRELPKKRSRYATSVYIANESFDDTNMNVIRKIRVLKGIPVEKTARC